MDLRWNFAVSTVAFNPLAYPYAERFGELFGARRTLPYYEDAPSGISQGGQRQQVASFVLIKLVLPEILIARRHLRKLAAPMLMPEASMDKYRYFPAGHDDVGCSRKISPMQAIAKTLSSEHPTDEKLGIRALATNSCHHSAAPFFGDNIGHEFYLPDKYSRSAQVCFRPLENSV